MATTGMPMALAFLITGMVPYSVVELTIKPLTPLTSRLSMSAICLEMSSSALSTMMSAPRAAAVSLAALSMAR